MEIKSWIIDCLDTYGNVSLPLEMYKEGKEKKLEKELSKKAGYPVKIRVAVSMWDSTFCNYDKRSFKETYIIAERVNK